MKSRNKLFNLKKYNHIIISVLIICLVLFLSIGFSAFQNNLLIDGIGAVVKIDKDVRIMGVRVDSTNDGVSLYEDYNVSNIQTRMMLPNEDSYIIYEVDVYNLGNVEMAIKNISNNNDNLKIELLDYKLKDKLCVDNECSLGVKKKIKIKVSYQDGKYNLENTSMDIKLDFVFAQVFKVEYYNVSGSENFPTEVVEGDELELSFSKGDTDILRVKMNNKSISLGSGYTYQNNILTIFDVSGDIRISINELTVMQKKIVATYIDSGNINDVPSYDLDSLTQEEKTNLFSNIATESGIYETTGINGGDVIIFRGDISDNYVQFGGYLWRILQIDEEGNLKLIMDGIIGRGAYQSTSTINSVDEANNVLGFENSSAKTILDNWFSYLNDFSSRIVRTKFCNDFDYISKTSSGSSNKTNYFKSYQNLGSDTANYSPSLKCPSKYTFEENVGLISGEEYVLAGGAFEKNNTSFFLYNSSIYSGISSEKGKDYFWTLSPAFHDEGRKNGGVMIVDDSGALRDWTFSLLLGNFGLRPVITIDGNYEMGGDGTKSNPYYYTDISQTATKVGITDVSTLNNNTYFIGNIGGKKNVDGLMSATISYTLKNVNGLLGKDTATFSNDKSNIINKTAIAFTFVDGSQVSDDNTSEYYYYLKTTGGEYLRINDDKSVELTTEPTQLRVKLGTLESRSGQVIISNKEETIYLNFYGAASNEGDDKFAGWTEIDDNAYMALYLLN